MAKPASSSEWDEVDAELARLDAERLANPGGTTAPAGTTKPARKAPAAKKTAAATKKAPARKPKKDAVVQPFVNPPSMPAPIWPATTTSTPAGPPAGNRGATAPTTPTRRSNMATTDHQVNQALAALGTLLVQQNAEAALEAQAKAAADEAVRMLAVSRGIAVAAPIPTTPDPAALAAAGTPKDTAVKLIRSVYGRMGAGEAITFKDEATKIVNQLVAHHGITAEQAQTACREALAEVSK